MGDFGKISWKKNTAAKTQNHPTAALKAFNSFLEFCSEISHNPILAQSCNLIEEERIRLKDAYKEFIDTLSTTPFIASFVIWIKLVGYKDSHLLDDAKTLLENGFIGIFDEDGSTWTLEKAKNFDHRAVLNGIRCRTDWTILRREQLVETYLSFLNWLSDETGNYIHLPKDPDRIKAEKRKLAFLRFIEFLNALDNLKVQLVAKLLYFGNERNLDAILNLQIEQINISQKKILWLDNPETISDYPEHVFNDIKFITKDRKEGPLFLGRQGALLSDATIFRNFNEAAAKVGLGESFGPKKLVAET